MERVIYIHQYFKTPEEGGAIRSYHIARGMVNRGIQVDLVTSHNKSNPEFKSIDGINVHYLPISYSNELSFLRRSVSFFKFALLAIKYINKLSGRPNLIYATSTPLTIGIIVLWIKWIKSIPFIFEVRDLWPEAPIQLGILRNIFLKMIARQFERTIYKNALKTIALSPGIQRGILHRYPASNVCMIPNMSDINLYHAKPAIDRKKSHLVIGYFGAFGFANNLDFILDLAKISQQRNLPIVFKLAGEGALKEHMEQKIMELHLHNMQIYPLMNHHELKETLKNVDACLTSFLNIPILETNSPNKFFDGLAAGKLSVVNTKGWIKELVEKNQCGIYIDPEQTTQFPKLIRPFINDPALLVAYQKNAIKLAKSKFDKENLVKKVCDLVTKTET